MEQIAPYIIPAFCLATGLILLCAGGRLLKSAIGLGCGLFGAGGGLLLAPSISIGIPPLIIALIFGIVSAILAVYIARLAILITLAISFAVVGPIITWHFADLGNGEQIVENVIEAATAPEVALNDQPTESQNNLSSTEQILISTIEMVANDITIATRSGIQRANSAWNAIPTGPRLILVGSSIVGLLVGLLVATFLPYFSAALVTSVGGSFLIIEGVRTIAAAIWNPTQLSNITPTFLVLTTFGIALAGLGLQLTMSRKKKKVIQTKE